MTKSRVDERAERFCETMVASTFLSFVSEPATTSEYQDRSDNK